MIFSRFLMVYSNSWMMFCYILLSNIHVLSMILMNFPRFSMFSSRSFITFNQKSLMSQKSKWLFKGVTKPNKIVTTNFEDLLIYFFMIFHDLFQFLLKILMGLYIKSSIYSSFLIVLFKFLMFFSSFSCFIQVFHVLFKFMSY